MPRENARREWPSTFSITYSFCPGPPPPRASRRRSSKTSKECVAASRRDAWTGSAGVHAPRQTDSQTHRYEHLDIDIDIDIDIERERGGEEKRGGRERERGNDGGREATAPHAP